LPGPTPTRELRDGNNQHWAFDPAPHGAVVGHKVRGIHARLVVIRGETSSNVGSAGHGFTAEFDGGSGALQTRAARKDSGAFTTSRAISTSRSRSLSARYGASPSSLATRIPANPIPEIRLKVRAEMPLIHLTAPIEGRGNGADNAFQVLDKLHFLSCLHPQQS